MFGTNGGFLVTLESPFAKLNPKRFMPELLRIICSDTVRSHIHAGQNISVQVHRCPRRVGRQVSRTIIDVGITCPRDLHVPEQTLPGLLRIDVASHFRGLGRAQELEIAKKECLILLDRSAQAEPPNLLDELIPGQWWSRDLVRHLIRIETWRLIKERHVAMERIRAA